MESLSKGYTFAGEKQTMDSGDEEYASLSSSSDGSFLFVDVDAEREKNEYSDDEEAMRPVFHDLTCSSQESITMDDDDEYDGHITRKVDAQLRKVFEQLYGEIPIPVKAKTQTDRFRPERPDLVVDVADPTEWMKTFQHLHVKGVSIHPANEESGVHVVPASQTSQAEQPPVVNQSHKDIAVQGESVSPRPLEVDEELLACHGVYEEMIAIDYTEATSMEHFMTNLESESHEEDGGHDKLSKEIQKRKRMTEKRGLVWPEVENTIKSNTMMLLMDDIWQHVVPITASYGARRSKDIARAASSSPKKPLSLIVETGSIENKGIVDDGIDDEEPNEKRTNGLVTKPEPSLHYITLDGEAMFPDKREERLRRREANRWKTTRQRQRERSGKTAVNRWQRPALNEQLPVGAPSKLEWGVPPWKSAKLLKQRSAKEQGFAKRRLQAAETGEASRLRSQRVLFTAEETTTDGETDVNTAKDLPDGSLPRIASGRTSHVQRDQEDVDIDYHRPDLRPRHSGKRLSTAPPRRSEDMIAMPHLLPQLPVGSYGHFASSTVGGVMYPYIHSMGVPMGSIGVAGPGDALEAAHSPHRLRGIPLGVRMPLSGVSSHSNSPRPHSARQANYHFQDDARPSTRRGRYESTLDGENLDTNNNSDSRYVSISAVSRAQAVGPIRGGLGVVAIEAPMMEKRTGLVDHSDLGLAGSFHSQAAVSGSGKRRKGKRTRRKKS